MSTSSPTPSAADILQFWREAGPGRWFRKDAAFDAQFRDRFLQVHEAAAAGALDAWRHHADGALALLVLLDQFPRNAFRDSPRMFATDAQALGIARQAVKAGFDAAVDPALKSFFYMPFMHSETLADQDACVALCVPLAGETLKFARLHREIIERFGRFPHRNAVLGRETTAEEQKFLEDGGFAG